MKIKRYLPVIFALCLTVTALPVHAEDYIYYDDDYGDSELYYNDDSGELDSGSYETVTESFEPAPDYSSDIDNSGETYLTSGESDETAEEPAAEEETAGEETAGDEIPPFDPSNIVEGEISTNSIPGWPNGPSVKCASAVLIEETTGTVLYAADSDRIYYPSSPVKIMTCLLALENCELSDEVTFTETGVSGVTDGATTISAQVDEVFTVEQLLYAIMLSSANDASLQIAEYVGGSVDFFVEMMNDRAREIGCNGTVFTNPTGLTDEGQHSTAHDLALIMKTAMENEKFREIAETSTYTIPATNLSGGERNLTNSFPMTDPGSDGYYPACIAGKEGYTEASGSVLVCMAEKNDLKLICAVMRGEDGTTADQAAALLDYGFNNFNLLDIGSRDFSVIDGGIVLVPNGASAADVESVDETTEEGQFFRQYMFGTNPVGSATALIVEEKEDPAIEEGRRNMEEALENSSNFSIIPYILIIGAGLLIGGFVLFLIIRTVKKK